jgi:hypothetical protein
MELVAYINTSGRPNRRECSEHRDSDVKRLGCEGAGTMPRGTVRVYEGILGIPYKIRTRRFLGVFLYIYIYIYIYHLCKPELLLE